MHPLRVAVVQAAPVVFDVEKTLAKVQDLVADATHQSGFLIPVQSQMEPPGLSRRAKPAGSQMQS